MFELEIDVPTPDGAMNSFFVRPDQGGPHPAVVMLMDAPGVRETLRTMARRLATNGYAVLLPNLFYRIARVVQTGPTRNHPDADRNRAEMLARRNTLSNALVTRDVAAALDALARRDDVRPARVGLVGYCMSGAFAVVAAAALPERVACAASFYGTKLVTDTPDSPHLVASHVKGELYFAFAEIDPFVPVETAERLLAQLATTSVRHRIEIYPGADHGFAFDDRGTYHPVAAERHWEALLDLFRRNVPTCPAVART